MALVEFKANGGMAPGYLAMPDGNGPFPGIVVIQEYWGMNSQIKGVADRLAGEGFAALVPDLYRGKMVEEPDDARKLAMELDRQQAMKDIQGAVDYLVDRPDVQPKKAGVVGFCMGGRAAGMMALEGKHVAAVVAYYGDMDLERAGEVAAPFLGLYGEEDRSIPTEKVEEIRRALSAQGSDNEVILYPGAGHAFANEERLSYRPEAAEDAWQRTVDWFRRFVHYP